MRWRGMIFESVDWLTLLLVMKIPTTHMSPAQGVRPRKMVEDYRVTHYLGGMLEDFEVFPFWG